MNEDRGTRYQRLRRRTTMVAAAWAVLLTAVLLVSGTHHSIRDAGWRAVAFLPAAAQDTFVPAVCALALVALHELVLAPLLFVGRYGLDRRFGLTTQRPSAWCTDHARAVAVGGASSVLAATAVYAAIRTWPAHWWLPVWTGALCTGVFLLWAVPAWFVPRLSRITPLRREELVRRLNALAARAGVRAIGVYAWHLGAASPRANAVLTGLGASRRILLSEALLADYSDDEIEVILAHELAHHAGADTWKTMAVEAVVLGVSLLAGQRALEAMGGAVGLTAVSDPAGLPLLVLAGSLVAACATPALRAVSRAVERRADWQALELTRNPQAFTAAIRRLSAATLADEDPPGWVRLWFYSHPPVSERLALAGRWASRETR
ncbi:MAG: M48 family metalloprotease [Vicinamibacterales bacterium]|nr:M48 family metalloprotease [Vicinamibacterales bacterium]